MADAFKTLNSPADMVAPSVDTIGQPTFRISGATLAPQAAAHIADADEALCIAANFLSLVPSATTATSPTPPDKHSLQNRFKWGLAGCIVNLYKLRL